MQRGRKSVVALLAGLMVLASATMTAAQSVAAVVPTATPPSTGAPVTTRPATCPDGFTDLGGFGWAAQDIERLAGEGIAQGVVRCTFDPRGEITRGQLAVFLLRLLGLPAPQSPVAYSDVSPGDWDYPAIEALAADFPPVSATGGRAVFAPDQPIDRQDVAATVVNLLVKTGKRSLVAVADASAVLSIFKDGNSIAPALRQQVATAVKNGILLGYPDGNFRPDVPMSRAQIAVMLVRLQDGFPGVARRGPGGTSQGQATGCPDASAYVPPSVPALFYLIPIPVPGKANMRCPAAVDWSGRLLGAIPAIPPCVEVCRGTTASPDGKILIEGGQVFPPGAATEPGATTMDTVWSSDSRYLCGIASISLQPAAQPPDYLVSLLWRSRLGPEHRVAVHLAAPTGRFQIDACDPKHDRVVLADQYGLYTRMLAVVRLRDGHVMERWSFPGRGPNDETGSPTGVHATLSLDGAVVAETPFDEGAAGVDVHAVGRPTLRSTATGQVLDTLPAGWVLALNAPGTLALFTARSPSGPVDVKAVHAPWRTPEAVVSDVYSAGAIAEPAGGRVALDVSWSTGGEVLIVGAKGSVQASFRGYQLLAP